MAKFEEYQAFVTIIDAGSLAQAARMLHLSPSAVSKKLAVLEQRLDVQLIDRSTRSLALTEQGKRLYNDCRGVLSAIRDMENRLHDSKGEPMGKLTLSCPRVMLQRFFLRLLNQFSDRYPGIKIDLKISDSLEDLIEGKIDFAFRIGQLKDSRLVMDTLLETRPLFCASPDYLKAHGTPAHLGELKDHTLIIPTYLNLSERLGVLFPGQGALDLEQFHTTDDVHALYHLVREAGGISMLLDIAIREDLESGCLTQLFPAMHFPSMKLVLISHKSTYQPKKMEVFRAFIQEALRR